MKILIDTNIILDIIEKRINFVDNSFAVLQYASNEEIDCILNSTTITDIYYVARRNFKDRKMALDAIVKISSFVRICDTLALDIMEAMNSGIVDFEDAVIEAVAFREKADFIVTRNITDFKNSKITAITPESFLEKMKGQAWN